jgi:hypothetical protein
MGVDLSRRNGGKPRTLQFDTESSSALSIRSSKQSVSTSHAVRTEQKRVLGVRIRLHPQALATRFDSRDGLSRTEPGSARVGYSGCLPHDFWIRLAGFFYARCDAAAIGRRIGQESPSIDGATSHRATATRLVRAISNRRARHHEREHRAADASGGARSE